MNRTKAASLATLTALIAAAASASAQDSAASSVSGLNLPQNPTVFGTSLPCSSTKGYTGHTLGAAGGVEASIALLALQHGLAPSSLNLQQQDPTLHAGLLRAPLQRPLRVVASNSFGFGGSNASLVFGAAT